MESEHDNSGRSGLHGARSLQCSVSQVENELAQKDPAETTSFISCAKTQRNWSGWTYGGFILLKVQDIYEKRPVNILVNVLALMN